MALPSDDQLKNAIQEILKKGNLANLSSKKVRKTLETRFGIILTERKQEIDDMLMRMLEDEGEQEEAEKGEQSNSDEPTSSNGTRQRKASSSSSGFSDVERSPPRGGSRPKKARRNSSGSGDEDEKLARQLQQEELGFRPRKSRTGSQPKIHLTKEQRELSAKKKPRKKGSSTYSRECVLSDELAAVMGVDRMARKDVVSKMWKIFKERELMDPKNKQFVNCDDQLLNVFKVKRFKAFGMMKILKNHIKDPNLTNDS